MGWEGDLEDELSTLETGAERCQPASVRTNRRSTEELIEDRYAVLQALSSSANEPG